MSIEVLGETVVSTSTSLFTSSFKVDTFPLEKKTGEPLTVHKKDDKMDRGNYCPLSILSLPSKILESCLNDVIVDHVLSFNYLVRENQWAYHKGYLTELLLVHDK